ncbi:hypothetical protein [Wuhan aphid virus 1]|uniref:hypothetical protein n=1 Tax=Wuhan aphid virus 1 TaxID=1746067 RepID=UPI0007066734|nr:hypothetical protein [Wuhan aphid virus 1]ALL52903.1 hypothetical protein [Wuhan aphid virus 1]
MVYGFSVKKDEAEKQTSEIENRIPLTRIETPVQPKEEPPVGNQAKASVPIWEEGLTEDMKRRGKQQYQERKEKEEEMFARRQANERHFKRHAYRLLDRWSYIWGRDIINPYLVDQGYDGREVTPYMVIALYSGTLLFLAYLLAKIWFMLPMILYAALILVDTEVGWIAQALFGLFLTTKIIKKCFLKTPEDVKLHEQLYHYPFRNTQSVPAASLKISESLFYIDMILLIALTWASHEYPSLHSLKGAQVIFTVVFLARRIPGAGGNSTVGLMTMAMIGLLALMMIPEVFDTMLSILIRRINPPQRPVHMNPCAGPQAVLKDVRLPWDFYLGIRDDSFTDLIRVALGYFVMAWMIFDDWKGPGVATAAFVEIRKKGLTTLAQASGGLYTANWWILLTMDVALSVYTASVQRLLTCVISIGIAYVMWKTFGAQVWVGRGQGANVTDGRRGYGMIFGQGPIGHRIFVARIALALSVLCVLFGSRSNLMVTTAILGIIGIMNERFMTITFSLLTLNWAYLVEAWRSPYPLTQQLRHSNEDVGQEIGEHSGPS